MASLNDTMMERAKQIVVARASHVSARKGELIRPLGGGELVALPSSMPAMATQQHAP